LEKQPFPGKIPYSFLENFRTFSCEKSLSSGPYLALIAPDT